jgi:hypothetical protein
VSLLFLGLNGFSLTAFNERVVLTIQRHAAGDPAWPDPEAWLVLQSVAGP